jgi:hypothetical protein
VKARAVLAAFFLVNAWTSTAIAQTANCPFTYNDRVREDLVRPALHAKEGNLSNLYDLKRPGILLHDGKVDLIFGLKNIMIVDPPNFIVVIDACKHRVISAGETTPNLITGVPANKAR